MNSFKSGRVFIKYLLVFFVIISTLPALAQTPPTATTGAVSGIGLFQATLNGTVNANGESTTVYFEYGTSAAYGFTFPVDQSPVSGTSATAVSATIYELSQSTTYHYRVVAQNAGGTVYGADMTFTTLTPPPGAITQPATAIGVDSATLNAIVHPRGLATDVTFEYGTDTSYGTTVTADNSPLPAVYNTEITMSKAITGLAANTVFYFRVVVSNSLGTSYGDPLTFTTAAAAAPTAATAAATAVGSETATLNGSVNANGTTTDVTFEYGLDTNYGRTVPGIPSQVTGTSNTAVSAVIDDVNANTTYHYRIVATYGGSAVYGSDMTFTTLPAPPTAVTNAASAVGTNGATLSGTVNANDGTATVTFEYGPDTNYGSTVTADQSPVTGSSDTGVSKAIAGLADNTSYHYRVIASSTGGTTYGADMIFTTGAAAPTAVTNAATGTGTTSATLNGTVNANNNDTTVTFQYGPDTNYGRTATLESPVTGSSDTPVSVIATPLIPATTYHYRIVAENENGTSYGADMTFTTRAAPTVTTYAATGVNATVATLNGLVNANGDSTTVTFQYGTSTAYGSVVTADQGPLTGNTATAVSKALTGLTSNTTYHYRAVGQNANGTTYGADMTFFSAVPAAPLATTTAATLVKIDGATLNGTVNANNADTTVTFEYGTTTSYGTTVTADQGPVTGSTNTAVSKAITGLANNTTYHYRVVAINAQGATYGADMTFETGFAPAAITQPATNVGGSSATLNGTVNSNGFSTTVTFEYGTSTSYGSTVNANPNFIGTTDDTAVNANISGLLPNTTYHFRVKAQGFGTTYGADMTFTTTSAPAATTNPATSVGSTTATLKGTVNANNSSATVTFQYGLNTNYGKTASANPGTVTGSANTAVSSSLSSLVPSTTYHYRVVAATATDTVYGADLTFTTGGSSPTATTGSATAISSTGATLKGTVNAKGDSTTVTFQYGTTAAYGSTVTAAQSPVTGSSNTAVNAVLTGLTNNTTYHYRVVAQNGSGTTYGADMTFFTDPSSPTATTQAATNINDNGATLNGTVNANNNSTAVTFEFGPDTNYGRTFTAAQSPVTGSADTPVSFTVSGLAVNTSFHYRVVAQNSSGTVYGADMTFTTTAPKPTATTGAATGVFITGATLNGTVNANGVNTTVTFQYGTSASYGTTVTADQNPVTGSADTPVSKAITGLTPNTTYHYRVVGQNIHGTDEGADMTFTTGAEPPTVTTQAASGITTTAATLNGLVNANNDSTTVTFQYGTTTSYGTTVTADQSPVTGNIDTAVSKAVTGLAPNTTYHYRVVGQNSGGATDGADMTFTTAAAPPTATTDAASGITATEATLNGTVNANNDSTTVTFEYGTDNTYGTTVTADQSPVTGNTDTAVSKAITGLTPNTTYHYRVVGQNSSGTTNGADMTFTTLPPQTPTVTTKPVTKINYHTAKSGGNVTDEGATPVTARGVVWSSSPNPTLADDFTVNDSGPGLFNSTMNQLIQNTTYYVRAYATNSFGTSYGEEFQFTTDSKHVSVSLIKPKQGDVVSGIVKVQAVAHATGNHRSSGPKIAKVEFYIDGGKIAEDSKNPYKTNWDTSTFSDGVYTVKAKATDTSGNYSEDSVTVTVNNTAPQQTGTAWSNRSKLVFNAFTIGKKKHLVTLPQFFLLRTTNHAQIDWTLTMDAGWISTLPNSGKGPRVVIVFANPKGMSPGTHTATINIIDPATSAVMDSVAVSLNISQNRESAPPSGAMDAPADGVTANNSLPITGWALDDIEVTDIKIYRSPLAGEGSGLVYIGDATLMDNARPDIEANSPDIPLNYRAGWGYLLDTNSLPNQGNGTFTLTARATDKEGNIVTLGTRTITVDNAGGSTPFGAIDPVSPEGMVTGWTLTPQPNIIPIDGSTITVWVDGVPMGHVDYNQYLETIADAFPGYNNRDGAGGSFSLDTTSMANGLHTIAWTAVDSAGNSDVTGVRYFYVDNPGNPGGNAIDRVFKSLEELESSVPMRAEPGYVTKGFSPDGTAEALLPDESGTGALTVRQLEPVELYLGQDIAAASGYLVSGNMLRDLPTGSTLDIASGRFSWIPAAGNIGNYTMVFVTRDAEGNYSRTMVRFTVEPRFMEIEK